MRDLLAEAFRGIDGVDGIYVLRAGPEWKLYARRAAGAHSDGVGEACFEAFRDASDAAVAMGFLDPTKEWMTFVGVVDIVPQGAERLSEGD